MAIERSRGGVGGGSVTAHSISFGNIGSYSGSASTGGSRGAIVSTQVRNVEINFDDIVEPEKYANAVGFVPRDALAATGATIVHGIASLLKGFLKVGENIVDGIVMLGGDIVVAGCAVANWAGADIDTQQVKDNIQSFVQTDWVGDQYQKLVTENEWIQQNSVLSPKMEALLETGGTIAGYALVNAIPGVGGSVVAAFGAAGSASEIAFQNGATFEQASVVAWVAGASGFAADYGLDKLGKIAKGTTSLGQAFGLTGAGMAVGVTEPVINVTTQYLTYGKNITDANGNPVYKDYWAFANDNNLWLQMGIGGGIGGGSVALKAFKAYGEIKPWASQDGITEEMVKRAEANYQQHPNDFTSRKDYYRTMAEVESASEYAKKIGIDPVTGREIWSSDVRIPKDDPGITGCVTDGRKAEWQRGVDAVTDPTTGQARVNVVNGQIEGFEKYVLGTDPADYGTYGRPNDYNFVMLGERDAQAALDAAADSGVGVVQQLESDIAVPITSNDRAVIISYDVDAKSIEMPTGREIGSNNQRIPGGRLPNGVQEGVHSTVKINGTIASRTNVTVVQNGVSTPVWQGTLEQLKDIQRRAVAGDSAAVKQYAIIFK